MTDHNRNPAGGKNFQSHPAHKGDFKTQLKKAREAIRRERNKNQLCAANMKRRWMKRKHGKNTVAQPVARPRNQDEGSGPQGVQGSDHQDDQGT